MPGWPARYLSAAAELVKRQATRSDIGFDALIEAELLVFLATLVDGDVWWYPGTLHYSGHGQVPDFFIRAIRHADFLRLGRIFGVEEADALRRAAHGGWHWNSTTASAEGDLLITVVAYQAVQVVRRHLATAVGERASWTTLRNILAGQQRVTATFRRADGRTLHVRTATAVEPGQKAIYDALGIDPHPGGTQKTIV